MAVVWDAVSCSVGSDLSSSRTGFSCPRHSRIHPAASAESPLCAERVLDTVVQQGPGRGSARLDVAAGGGGGLTGSPGPSVSGLPSLSQGDPLPARSESTVASRTPCPQTPFCGWDSGLKALSPGSLGQRQSDLRVVPFTHFS